MPDDRPLIFPNIERTSQDLREGIETSRRIVEQSRVLIELSESDPPPPPSPNDQAAG